MMSDDGEHTCVVAKALCASGGEVNAFRTSLAWQFRWWFLGIPAGIGGATLRAILKLWIGFPPEKSGVFSAGNGPAMRSAILGAAINNPDQLRQLVLASTRITHTDPKAFHGAMAVAIAAQCAAMDSPAVEFLDRVRSALVNDSADETIAQLQLAAKSAAAGNSSPSFAEQLGCGNGVSGYVLKSVPVAIHAWLRNPRSYEAAVIDAIQCGGDTDTVAAITGGIVASGLGVDAIPLRWRSGLAEWPRNNAWIGRLSEDVHRAVAAGEPAPGPKVGPLVILRNVVFMLVVLAHILRRMLPPY